MQSGVIQAIGELVRKEIANPGSADAEKTAYIIPGAKSDNVYPIFKHYFNAEAQKVMDIKANGMYHQRERIIITPGLGSLLNKLGLKSCRDAQNGVYLRELDSVCFCASMADRLNVHKAVENVIKTVNNLASRGYITATMVELSVVHLNVDKPEPDYAVLSYVALTKAGQVYVTQNMPKMFVREGEVPERYENQ
jgi:hypothetical protein